MYGGFDSLEPPYFFLIALLNICLSKNLIEKKLLEKTCAFEYCVLSLF